MFEAVRWITLHPALVHFPLGALVFMTVAYAVAARRKTAHWVFSADLLAVFAAVSCVLAAAAGFIAYFTLSWPGGFGFWPLTHLVLGVITTVLSVSFSTWRLRARARGALPGSGVFLGALLITVISLATGYIGGEILVFRGGAAVAAAANGALAPPLVSTAQSPSDVREAMQSLRPLWAGNLSDVALDIVNEPAAARANRIATRSDRMQKLARWLRDWGAPKQHAEDWKKMAGDLEQQLAQLEASARHGDLGEMAASLGRVTQQCAHCHADTRWKEAPGVPAHEGGGTPPLAIERRTP